jgi:hypothetical protein
MKKLANWNTMSAHDRMMLLIELDYPLKKRVRVMDACDCAEFDYSAYGWLRNFAGSVRHQWYTPRIA